MKTGRIWPKKKGLLSPYGVAVLVIFSLAAALRFHALGGHGLSSDEAVYADNSFTNFAAFIANTRHANSSPIFLPYIYFLLGESVRTTFWIRVLPAVFSTAAVGVVLAMPLAGVRRSASALAACLLTFAPGQIFYAQQVREYSLSVLVSALVIFWFTRSQRSPSPGNVMGFAICLLAAPLMAYGNCFLVLAVLAVGGIGLVWPPKSPLFALLVPLCGFVLGLVATYLMTAKYQMGVAQAFYLLDGYPPGNPMMLIKWLPLSLATYFNFFLGNALVAVAAFLFIAIHICARTAAPWRSSEARSAFRALQMEAVLAVLICGSLLAAALHLYPFGGIRQQTFAAPLVCLCFARALVWASQALKGYWRPLACAGLGVLFLALMEHKIAIAYRGEEDILPIVNGDLAKVNDDSVYVYYGAIPAMQFHVPQRRFHYGTMLRGSNDKMAREALGEVSGCTFHVVFSQIFMDEDLGVISRLQALGAHLIVSKRYTGSDMASFSRCRSQ